MRAALLVFFAGCVPRPAPVWHGPERLPRACAEAGLSRQPAVAAAQLREAAAPSLSLHTWSAHELQLEVGRRPTLPPELALVHATVSYDRAPPHPVSPRVYVELGAQQWSSCTTCGKDRLARMLDEFETEVQTVPPPTRTSRSSKRRTPKIPKPKGALGALVGVIMLPVAVVVGGVVALGSAASALAPKPSGPTTRTVQVWGGSATDKLHALAHPSCHIKAGEADQSCVTGGFFERLGDDYDPVVHGVDRVSVALVHSVAPGCIVRDVHTWRVPLGTDPLERLRSAHPDD